MTAPEITIAEPADRDRVLASVVPAFAGDPVVRYLFPDDGSYPRLAAAFFGQLFDKRVHRGTVWLADKGASVAMWDGPPVADDVPPPQDFGLPADAQARSDAYDEAVHAIMPAEPCWYLGVLATHPDHTGRRLGRAVMAAGLHRAGTDGLPAVLETSTEANVALYRRSGWEVHATTTVGPVPIWVMRHGGPVSAT